MGLLGEIGAMSSELGGTNAAQRKVAGGLMQVLQEHPGGIGGLINTLRQNGLAEHVEAWTSGQAKTIAPQQIQQGLNGTSVIEQTAARTGVSPELVTLALTTLLPLALRHFAPGGETVPQGQLGSLAQQLLNRLL